MNKILKICLSILAFIPLVVDNSIFTPENSNFFMRSVLVLSSIFFLIGFLSLEKFRNKITEKIKLLIKNPLFISILSFIFIFIISTIFAINKHNAFWGIVERAEGLVGIIYFFSFFIFSLLIFEKKDWLWFFKLSLLTSFVLLFKEFMQFFSGVARPDSFIGNPTFLAGYLLFSIFCSIEIFQNSIPLETVRARNKDFSLMGWKYFSVLIFILSILGIFITQTRGTIFGLALGFLFLLIYGIIKGKDISYKKLSLRTFSIIILFIMIIFSSIFITTRKSEIWQQVPGLSRVASISSSDSTTKTRLLMSQLSLNSVGPKENGLKKFLIGWGPENFSLAYGKYFIPEQFKYEVGWFDRSHNKLFDILVMNGLLGLISYLTIYFFFLRYIFKRKNFSLTNVGLLFFGISFFGHLLFVFDQITTWIPFFTLLSFIIVLVVFDEEKLKNIKNNYKTNKIYNLFVGLFFLILMAFLSFVYFRNDLPAYSQIKNYDLIRKKSEANDMLSRINLVFDPFTTAQAKIRYDFLSFMSENYKAEDESIVKLSDISFERADEYAIKNPLDLQFINFLAINYTFQGKKRDNSEFLKRGEEYSKKILLEAPNKLDFNYGLALNWLYQKKYIDSFNLFEEIFDSSPGYFSQKKDSPEGVYSLFIKYFYEVKDKENFIKTAKRLKENNYSDSIVLDEIIDFINKTGVWPNINFK